MTARALVDSNVLIYCYDLTDVAKQQRSLETLEALSSTATGALSAQVLAEFFVNVTFKIPEPLTVEEGMERVTHYVRSWTVFDVTTRVVQEATRGVRQHRLHYWDAQIWAVARLHRIPVILSEDFSDGAVLEGVRFLNPFRAGFRAADLIKSI